MKNKNFWIIVLLIVVGVALRLFYVTTFFIIDGDSAAAGLLAKHILEGREFPIYPPLAHYGGTLNSYAEALFFWFFGVSTLSLQVVGFLFSCLWGLTAYLLARRAFGFSSAMFALLFLAFPPAISLFLSSLPTGVYAETFIFTPLLLFLLLRWSRDPGPRLFSSFWLGLSLGVGLWLTPWMVPVALTVVTVFLLQRKKVSLKVILLFALAFLIGYFPAIIYNFQYPGAQLFRFGGRVLDLDRQALSSTNMPGLIWEKLCWRFSTVPASLARIIRLLIDFVGVINVTVFAGGLFLSFKRNANNAQEPKIISPMRIVLIFMGWHCLFYAIATGEDHPRFIAPLLCLFPVVFGFFCMKLFARSRLLCCLVAGLLLLSNGCHLWKFTSRQHGLAYKTLSSWMLNRGCFYGYADAWIAYPVMFESREKILLSPTLFHPTFEDRWPGDTALIREKQRAVFVINKSRNLGVEPLIEERLKKLGVSYEKDTVEEFVVFGNFSRKVLPEELGLSGEKPVADEVFR